VRAPGSRRGGWVFRSLHDRQVSFNRRQVSVEIRKSLLEQAVDGRKVDLRVQVNDPVAKPCHPSKIVAEGRIDDSRPFEQIECLYVGRWDADVVGGADV
jgi:hypothetical protein